ncbi:MAG: ribosome-associated translation inhibitor RaiA [Actinomycetota bacterium]|nr:ribosome-associated translation inhibitor RaiA [Actinomycetota bacterium]
MNVVVSARHIDLTPALKSYAEEKVAKFDRFLSNITDAKVTLVFEKNAHKAEVLLNANGILIWAESTTGDIYAAIDEVIEKLDQQVKRYKGKQLAHRKGESGKAIPELSSHIPDEGGRIIKTKRFGLKPMSAEEASMQMELLGKAFFIFTNAGNGEINVIYKRNDGNYGLIEPVR